MSHGLNLKLEFVIYEDGRLSVHAELARSLALKPEQESALRHIRRMLSILGSEEPEPAAKPAPKERWDATPAGRAAVREVLDEEV